MRNEVAKQQRTDEEMREQRDQQKMDIAKLNMMINQAEEQMVELRKRYETAVKNRADRSDQNTRLAFTSLKAKLRKLVHSMGKLESVVRVLCQYWKVSNCARPNFSL